MSSSSPRAGKQERRPWVGGGADSGGQGLGGGSGVRGKGEGSPRGRSLAAARAEAARVGMAATACGSGRRRLWAGDSESRLGLRSSGDGSSAVAGFGMCGGGVVAKGRWRAVAERLVELGSDPGVLFKGELRRWSGRGGLVPSGERRGEP